VETFDNWYYNQKEWKQHISSVHSELVEKAVSVESTLGMDDFFAKRLARRDEKPDSTEFSPFQSAEPTFPFMIERPMKFLTEPDWKENDLYRPFPPFQGPPEWETFSSPIKASIFNGTIDFDHVDNNGSFKRTPIPKDVFLLDDILSSLAEKGISLLDTPVPELEPRSQLLLDIQNKTGKLKSTSTAVRRRSDFLSELRQRTPLKKTTVHFKAPEICPIKLAVEEKFRSLSKIKEAQRHDMEVALELSKINSSLFKDILSVRKTTFFAKSFVEEMDKEFPSFVLVRKQLKDNDYELESVEDQDFFLVRTVKK